MRFVFLFIGVLCFVTAQGQVRWHCEESDTARVTEMLIELSEMRNARPGERVSAAARLFLGRPYVAHTLEGDEELLTVNLDELDCTTLVDVALALAYTAGEGRTGWQDFVYNLRRMRYRGGEVNGYASRLHYNCDWAVENIHHGIIVDVAKGLSRCDFCVRSIDFMSANRDKYPALRDSAEFERVKMVETGLRNHRFGYVKTMNLNSKEVTAALREGDILGFVSNMKNLDVTHLGILTKVDGEWRVLHASSSGGRVMVSETSLADFVKRNRGWIGARIYRLKD